MQISGLRKANRVDHRVVSENVNSTIGSASFRYIFAQAFSPLIKRWKIQLTQDMELPDDQRRGLLVAYNKLYEGFLEMYENCDLEPPEWFYKEFDRVPN